MWKTLSTGGKAVVVAAVVGLTALAAAPARADHNNAETYGTAFVDGAGTLTNDFGEHRNELGGYLCHGCANSWNTDLVVMWQAILYIEGELGAKDIDGLFGSQTDGATRGFQSRHGLAADGVVGPATWGEADDHLNATPNAATGDVNYNGPQTHSLRFCRGDCDASDGGAYQLKIAFRFGDRVIFSDSAHRIDFFSRSIQVQVRCFGGGSNC